MNTSRTSALSYSVNVAYPLFTAFSIRRLSSGVDKGSPFTNLVSLATRTPFYISFLLAAVISFCLRRQSAYLEALTDFCYFEPDCPDKRYSFVLPSPSMLLQSETVLLSYFTSNSLIWASIASCFFSSLYLLAWPLFPSFLMGRCFLALDSTWGLSFCF
jgi:hypothetical protein